MADITIHVDNAKGVVFLNACKDAAGNRIEMYVELQPQQQGESDIAYGKRCIVDLAKTLIKTMGQANNDRDYRDAINAISLTVYEVDPDILT